MIVIGRRVVRDHREHPIPRRRLGRRNISQVWMKY
jgi:hypothetical protein